MKCSKCGIENDETSKFCKNCGRQLIEQEAEYVIIDDDESDINDQDVTCPNCGSTNIHFVTKEEGSDYDAGNACCGYFLFGPIGLICGLFSGKTTDTVRKCMKCGHEF
ncbi:MAG: hypothetical protein K0Q49_2091 [Haloplasmataceae bacterium]|jgi:DNA-directed RNA polymerase subunit RPC12/RpoP|nr:hypothetical protein [Haloplasmataceae bacterium]